MAILTPGVCGTVTLSWLPNEKAYAVRFNGRFCGLVICGAPFPFKRGIMIELA